MTHTSGITTSTFTNRNANGQRAHAVESGEPGSDPSDRVTPANNAPGYELPGGFAGYSQTDKRERKHTPTAAETGPKAQSSHTRGPKPAARRRGSK